jgi:hypothetical protein
VSVAYVYDGLRQFQTRHYGAFRQQQGTRLEAAFSRVQRNVSGEEGNHNEDPQGQKKELESDGDHFCPPFWPA